jgi:hypothetical protein
MTIRVSRSFIRLVEFLEAHGPMDTQAIADNCHMVRRQAQHIISQMRKVGGLVYIAAWDRYGDGQSGNMAPRYAIGNQADAPKPKRVSNKVAQRNRAQRLREAYGSHIAWRMMESRHSGGADRIVIDGKTIYERGKVRNPGGRYG